MRFEWKTNRKRPGDRLSTIAVFRVVFVRDLCMDCWKTATVKRVSTCACFHFHVCLDYCVATDVGRIILRIFTDVCCDKSCGGSKNYWFGRGFTADFCFRLIDGAEIQNYTKPGPPLLRVGCFIAVPRIITAIIFSVFGGQLNMYA